MEDDSATIVVPLDFECLTRDNKLMQWSLTVTLRKSAVKAKHSDSRWLDEYYRPVVVRAIREHISRHTYHDLTVDPQQVEQQLSQITHQIFHTLPTTQ